MSVIGKNMKKIRSEKGMTQEQLAESLHVTRQAVSNWERGNTMPDISKLPQISELFNTSIDEINNKMKESPETIANYFLTVIQLSDK